MYKNMGLAGKIAVGFTCIVLITLMLACTAVLGISRAESALGANAPAALRSSPPCGGGDMIASLAATKMTLLAGSSIAVVLAICLALCITRSITRPMEGIIAGLSQIPRELEDLAANVNSPEKEELCAQANEIGDIAAALSRIVRGAQAARTPVRAIPLDGGRSAVALAPENVKAVLKAGELIPLEADDLIYVVKKSRLVAPNQVVPCVDDELKDF